jgi:hypothetical protein
LRTKEAFRMLGVDGAEHVGPLGPDEFGAAVVASGYLRVVLTRLVVM